MKYAVEWQLLVITNEEKQAVALVPPDGLDSLVLKTKRLCSLGVEKSLPIKLAG
jgi:hypothetical protein